MPFFECLDLQGKKEKQLIKCDKNHNYECVVYSIIVIVTVEKNNHYCSGGSKDGSYRPSARKKSSDYELIDYE
jgi:hypothetical protein